MEMGISKNFSDETRSSVYDWLIYIYIYIYIYIHTFFWWRNLELSGPSLARAQRIGQKIVLTFFNMLEKLATKNNLSDTHGDI